jgi:hypothetical protein
MRGRGFSSWDQRGVNRLNAFAHDQAQRGITRGGDQVIAPFAIRLTISSDVAAGFDVDLTPGLFFKLVTQS